MMNRGSTTTEQPQPAAHAALSPGNLIALVLAMLMVYTIVLLWLGLSAPATAGLATTLASVSGAVVRRTAAHSRPRTPRPRRATGTPGATPAETSAVDSPSGR